MANENDAPDLVKDGGIQCKNGLWSALNPFNKACTGKEFMKEMAAETTAGQNMKANYMNGLTESQQEPPPPKP